jgi:adenine/guanine/hypoxanthine permease
VAWIGIVSLGIVLVGWLANIQFPFKIPAGLLAIIVGTILGWATGVMNVSGLQTALSGVALALPLPQLEPLLRGLPLIAPYLITAVPLAVYLFMETLNNVESASAEGDNYDTRETMLAAAGGTLVASLFGSPFPTLVYIGHPGWKSVGARVGYSWATGAAMLVLGTLGLLNVLLNIIPIVAILPILIYIGLVITSQAFTASPARHAPAVAIALVPWLADWARTQIDNSLSVAGTSAATLGNAALAGGGVFYEGMVVLGSGAILVAMILAAITAYIIDRNFKAAIGYALFGSICSFFGIIHGAQFGLNQAPGPAIGYLAIAGICAAVMFRQASEPEPQVSLAEVPGD